MSRKRNGFTMIELLAVVLIITLLAVFVVPRMFEKVAGAKRNIAKSKMAIIDAAIAKFYMDCDRFPSDSEGLDSLLEPPAELEEKWKGRYLKESELLDPWGNRYEYYEQGAVNVGSYDLVSYGADGAADGEGDNADIFND